MILFLWIYITGSCLSILGSMVRLSEGIEDPFLIIISTIGKIMMLF